MQLCTVQISLLYFFYIFTLIFVMKHSRRWPTGGGKMFAAEIPKTSQRRSLWRFRRWPGRMEESYYWPQWWWRGYFTKCFGSNCFFLDEMVVLRLLLNSLKLLLKSLKLLPHQKKDLFWWDSPPFSPFLAFSNFRVSWVGQSTPHPTPLSLMELSKSARMHVYSYSRPHQFSPCHSSFKGPYKCSCSSQLSQM